MRGLAKGCGRRPCGGGALLPRAEPKPPPTVHVAFPGLRRPTCGLVCGACADRRAWRSDDSTRWPEVPQAEGPATAKLVARGHSSDLGRRGGARARGWTAAALSNAQAGGFQGVPVGLWARKQHLCVTGQRALGGGAAGRLGGHRARAQRHGSPAPARPRPAAPACGRGFLWGRAQHAALGVKTSWQGV